MRRTEHTWQAALARGGGEISNGDARSVTEPQPGRARHAPRLSAGAHIAARQPSASPDNEVRLRSPPRQTTAPVAYGASQPQSPPRHAALP